MPTLNAIVTSRSEQEFQKDIFNVVLLFSLYAFFIKDDIFFLNRGFSVWWLAIVYILGAGIKKYRMEERFSRQTLQLLLISDVLITSVLKLLMQKCGMQDIEKRKVNCIIVKDLSRFGRNYIETGRYLERIFPFMGVRFIAINDHYDSAEENDDKGRILIPFNNLINDTYCRDISLRVRSHLDVKRKEGRFIGSFAGYGYRKDPKDKNHLIIDEYAAGIVQEMNGNVKP